MSDPTPTPTGGSGNVSLYAGSWQEGYVAGQQRAREQGKGAVDLPPPEELKTIASTAADEYMARVAHRYKNAYKDGYAQGFVDATDDLKEEARGA